MTIDQLEQAVLGLPAGERARLAERIIASLDADAEIEEIRRLSKEGRGGSRGWRFDRQEIHERA